MTISDERVKQRLAARLSAGRKALGERPAGIPVAEGPTPLSPAQARLWFLSQLDDGAAYNVPTAIRLTGELDPDALLGAVHDLAERHPVLRSTVDGETTTALPADTIPVRLAEVGREELAECLRREQQTPFDLATEPPARATLFRLAPDEHALAPDEHALAGDEHALAGDEHVPAGDEHVLALTVHHIAFDAWSRDLAVAELGALYAARLGGRQAPPPPRVRYGDYAAWLATRPEGDLAWWEARLAGLEGVLDLPTDRARPSVAAWTGAEVPVRLTPELAAKVRASAAERGCTPFMVFLAAWSALLSRISGTDDVPVGAPEAGRLHSDADAMLGCFVNTLVMRCDLSGDPTGAQLLARTREVSLDAFAHRDVPFERIVERLHPERSLATTPIFQVLLNVVDTPPAPPSFPDLGVEVFEPPVRTAKYDLNLSFTHTGDGYEGMLAYRTDLFEPRTAERMASWYLTLLDGMLSDPERPVGSIALEPVNGPQVAGRRAGFDLSRPVHELIEEQAVRHPEAIAATDAHGALTYRQADRLGNGVAHRLVARGLLPQEPVGVLTGRGTALVPALLGVLKAGGAYMPMEPAYPDDRLAYMAETAGARLVIASREHAGRVPGALVLEDLLEEAQAPPGVAVRPDFLSHVKFTSGSTGRPKGVGVEHRSLVHYLNAVRDHVGPGHDSFGVVSTIASDLILTCLFGALISGKTVHLVDQDAATDPALYDVGGVDVVKMVPSHLELLAAHGELTEVLPRRLLILAGEATSWELAGRIRAARPDLELQIHCGPTETTVSVLAGTAPSAPTGSGSVPLGRPLPGISCYIVDRHGRPLPAGVPGELWIAGPTVARGYLGMPELTAERFVPDPVTGADRCYRTGDRVRLNADGLVEFLGRVDDQVKIRGFRVELGEVKSALQEQPGVAEAAVLPVGEGHSRRLAAWVAPASVDVAELRAGLRERLPDYMVPAAIVVLDELPLTPLGKVDRARLPAPEISVADRVAPSTEAQLRVAAAWAQVLPEQDFGIDDDFFALGGDSFRAIKTIKLIDPSLRVIDLFTRPTVRELAAHLEAGSQAGSGLLHRLAGPRTARRTLVCVPYGGGSAASFGPLAAELGGKGTAVLAVELPGHDPARPEEAMLPLGEVVDRLAAELEDGGPVALYGHCVGSAVATELALRLETAGVEVSGLIVGGSFPDAQLPGRLSQWWNRRFPAHRWSNDRAQRDFLRTLGMAEDAGDVSVMVRGLRHDVEQAQAWFTRELQSPRKLRAPVLCVVGERDRATELYTERYREWGAFADRVELAAIPKAGHYFIKHQAEGLAELIDGHLSSWEAGLVPEPLETVEVVGEQARRDLRRFYTVAAGQTASLLGNALTSFALGVWAYQSSGRVSDYALVTMLALLPAVLASPLGGAVADRVDRRLVMLACDGVSALATAALVVLLWLGRLEVWQVGVIAAVLSLVTAFHRPAYLAAVAQLVPKPYLMQANALANLGTGLGMLIAPLAGAALITLVGVHGVIAVDVVTFLFGLATLLLVRFPDRLFRRLEESFWQAIAGGWRFLVRRRPLMVMIVFFAIENYFGMLALAITVPVVMGFGGVAGVGTVTALQGLGAVAGGLVMVFWNGTRRRAIGMVGFVSGFGFGIVLIGLQPSVWVAAFGGFVSWVFLSVLNAHWLAIIQLKVGLDLQGRVLATNQMLAVSMTPLAFLTAPALSAWFGPLLNPGGALDGTWVGDLVGVGDGRGVALLLAATGVVLVAWGALGLAYRPLRLMEDELPDAIAGAEIADNLDLIDRELASRK